MGKLFKYCNWMQILLFVIITGTGLICSAPKAFATQSCSIQNTFPSGYAHPPSEFGDSRNHNDGTMHTGTDFFFPNGQKIVVPQGCLIQENSSGNIVWEQNSKKSNGEPAGYGYYMVLDCGTFGGDTVKMRLAHLPKNPYSATTKEILQGDSGNASGGAHHYHTETLIGDRPVDTQCVLGMVKTNQNADGASAACKACPNIGAANLCDKSVRDALINHGKECTRNAIRPIEGGSTVDPDRIRDSGITSNPDSPSTPTGNGNGGDGGGNGMGTNDATGGTGNTTTPTPATSTGGGTPTNPPADDVPGTPGISPNLTPPPKKGTTGELSGCAADTWTAMVNQAVMETRREDILNKRFIVKPDSVLDYTCFSDYVKITADEIGPLFSENKEWANRKVDLIGKTVTIQRELGSKSLDGALMDVVQSVATNYKNGQFNNAFLAGSTPIAKSTKNCDVMNRVWKAAKCKNFDDIDVFYSFEDLKTKEPREFPANMKCN